MTMRFTGQINLHPPDSAVELRAYGFGVIPFDGKFTRFRGCVRYDPSTTDLGEVMLRIETLSLTMANPQIRDLILGMMDTARYPELAFRGTGQGGKSVVGALTMHGQTHGLALDYARAAGTATATGHIRRETWGITGNLHIAGSTIRIRVTLPDPFAAAQPI